MTRKKSAQRNDDKAYVIVTISRNEVRDMCGPAAADCLSDKDMQTLADIMSEYCFDDGFVEFLRETIDERFLESTEDAGD